MKHVKALLTMVALIGLVVVGSFVGWGLLTQDVPPLTADPEAGPTCVNEKFKSGTRLKRDQVTVNVYNAGTVSGLATGTMRDIVDAGFNGGSVGNAPQTYKTQRVVIVDPSPRSAEVRLVRAQFKGEVQVRRPKKQDLGRGIDVVVGNNFLGLKKKALKSVRVREATTVCVPAQTPEV